MEELEIAEPLMSVMLSCEVLCVAECCSIGAFDIQPQWIRVWIEENDLELLAIARSQIDELIEYMSELPGDYSNSRLNFDGSNTQWLQVLTQWKEAIQQAPSTPLPPPAPVETIYSEFVRQLSGGLLILGCGLLGASPIIAVILLVYWLLGRL